MPAYTSATEALKDITDPLRDRLFEAAFHMFAIEINGKKVLDQEGYKKAHMWLEETLALLENQQIPTIPSYPIDPIVEPSFPAYPYTPTNPYPIMPIGPNPWPNYPNPYIGTPIPFDGWSSVYPDPMNQVFCTYIGDLSSGGVSSLGQNFSVDCCIN